MSKTKKLAPRKKVALELLHQILGNRYTRSLIARGTADVWKDIDFRIYIFPLCTSCQISSMNKKDGSKNLLEPKVPFKWFYGYYPRNITKFFDR